MHMLWSEKSHFVGISFFFFQEYILCDQIICFYYRIFHSINLQALRKAQLLITHFILCVLRLVLHQTHDFIGFIWAHHDHNEAKYNNHKHWPHALGVKLVLPTSTSGIFKILKMCTDLLLWLNPYTTKLFRRAEIKK